MNTVVRSGNTVRRPSGPWTQTIHALLEHLHDHGVNWVPRPHGLDEQGREILDFLPGEVPAYPLPSWVWSDELLQNSARALRQFHNATVDFAPLAARWQLPPHGQQEVICHNDFAPYNFVCRNGGFVGLIDFDTASPGSRLWDLCYLAYRLVPLASPENVDAAPGKLMSNTGRRIDLLLQAYSWDFTAQQLVQAVIARLEDLAEFSTTRSETGGRPELAEHAKTYLKDAAYLRAGCAERADRPDLLQSTRTGHHDGEQGDFFFTSDSGSRLENTRER